MSIATTNHQNDDQWFAFRSYNSQIIYGWGSAADADRYTDVLNAKREIGFYGAHPLTDEETEGLALDFRTDVVVLHDELEEIEDQQEFERDYWSKA